MRSVKRQLVARANALRRRNQQTKPGPRCVYRSLLLSSLPVAVLMLAPTRAAAQDVSPWTRLERGAHAIGFRELLLRDPSRPSLPLHEGAPPIDAHGRQMQIVVWYPAIAGTGDALAYGDYVARSAQAVDFSPLDASRRRAAVDDYVARAAGLGGDTIALRAALPRLLATAVSGRLGARAATGRFPLVLFPDWRVPSVNSVLAEYLASHGYVVASTTTKGTYDPQVEYWSPRGLETMAADLRFVIAALDTIAFVDTRRIGAMGVGIAASGALALQMRTPAVAAMVSLEGGITTEGEMGLMTRTPFFEVANVRGPMLAITAPHPSVDPARLDLYRYATRYLVHFPRMGEFWFLDYGLLEGIVPRIIGQPPGDTEAGFEWGARFVRRFLDSALRDDADARAWLGMSGNRAGAPPGLFTVTTKPAATPPPTVTELKDLLRREGSTGLVRLVDERIAADSQPIPPEHFVEMSAWLANSGRDATGADRHVLARLRVRLYPGSARAHFSLAGTANRAGERALARTHFTEALRLLATDPDPYLDSGTRLRIHQQASAALRNP
ncbi:MAG TPA: hypothetical protein VLE53_16140 [Gemmatimonadaceae bacterium]|nr:hypothetical protein [Gemmatimonadaceae bacterium]